MRGYATTPVSQGGNELTTRFRALSALIIAAALMFSAVPAFAVPASKMAQARAVKSQIDTLDERVERASERYNEAAEKHAKVLKQKRAAAKKLKKVTKRMGVVQRHLNTRANNMYRTGPMAFVDVLLGAESFEEFSATWDLLRDLNSDDAAAVAELKSLRIKAKAAHRELTAKEKATAAQAAVMRRNERSIRAQLAQRKSKLAGLEREIAALKAAEEAARARTVSSWSRWRRWEAASSRRQLAHRAARWSRSPSAISARRTAGPPRAPTRLTARGSRCSSTARWACRCPTARDHRSTPVSA